MVESAARSDLGRRRTLNEDSYVALDDIGLFAVADGMGGHAGGEVASRITTDALVQFVTSSSQDSGITWPFGYDVAQPAEANQLQNAILLANLQIITRATVEPPLPGLGSTVVACMPIGSTLLYASVGDSRLYLWRKGRLSQVTQDDSWAASMLRAGASAEVVNRHEMRHVLTRALGSEEGLTVEVAQMPLEDGDLLLLCSDGLYGPVGDEVIAGILEQSGASLDQAAEALIAAANHAGGPDNITAVLIRQVDSSAPAASRRSPWTSAATDAPDD